MTQPAPIAAEWTRAARPVTGFSLDVGVATPAHCPAWLLPAGSDDSPRIALPALPITAGYVMSADAAGHEDELVRYYRRLPRPPPPATRRDVAPYCNFGVDLLLRLPGEPHLRVDMFGGGHVAARRLLGVLADTQAPASTAYDNLDQGWALLILVEADAVSMLDWEWESADPACPPRALRFARGELARHAEAALRRLEHLHARLVTALGADLWRAPMFEA